MPNLVTVLLNSRVNLIQSQQPRARFPFPGSSLFTLCFEPSVLFTCSHPPHHSPQLTPTPGLFLSLGLQQVKFRLPLLWLFPISDSQSELSFKHYVFSQDSTWLLCSSSFSSVTWYHFPLLTQQRNHSHQTLQLGLKPVRAVDLS